MKLPNIEVAKGKSAKSDALVLSWNAEKPEPKGKGKKDAHGKAVFAGGKDKGIDALAKRINESKHFSGRRAETSALHYFEHAGHPAVILLGLGPKDRFDSEATRQCGAATFFAQRRGCFAKLTLDGKSFFGGVDKADAQYFLQAFCEGYWLAGYKYLDLKERKDNPPVETAGLVLVDVDAKKAEKAIKKAQILSTSVMFTRSLGDRPANHLTPAIYAKLVEKMAKDFKLKCTVFGKARIEKEKMGLFLGVARGSVEEPKFIILEHKGGKASDRPIALVGKGITFDTGGISLKPSARMEEMKYDMMGSATVAGVMKAVAQLKIPLNVTGYIAATENMPGGKAQKPGDVMFSSNGKSVEIINTDAEGRLIMADTLEYAQKQNPQAIIDFATLTGAVIVALGTVATGIMGNDKRLLDRIKDAGDFTKEKVWELPLFEEFEKMMKSPVADIRNSSESREAGSSTAGIFLKFFVEKKFPWVHCDIAGSGMQRRDLNYAPSKNASGVMVRLITQMLEDWKPLK